MLTIYYATATFLQAHRIKNVCCKIAEQLAQQSSISFYTLPASSDDGYDIALATSDRCVNRNAAKVSQILWLQGNQRGCSVQPLQTLHVSSWISFPQGSNTATTTTTTTNTIDMDAGAAAAAADDVVIQPTYVPFTHVATTERWLQMTTRKNVLNLLLEMETEPGRLSAEAFNDIVRIENYGKMVAWKIDSHLAVLIETDVEHLTKLLVSTYLQSNFLINDQLPLIRIESVIYEGRPQPYELVSQHKRKTTRRFNATTNAAVQLSASEWSKHLEDLRELCVFTHQASEFESKQRTEGKTTMPTTTPDLIAHEKTKENEEKRLSSSIDGDAKSQPASGSVVTNETVATTSTTILPQTQVLTTTAISEDLNGKKPMADKEIAAVTTSPHLEKTDTKSPPIGKMKAKPTEIKKPIATKTAEIKVHAEPKEAAKPAESSKKIPSPIKIINAATDVPKQDIPPPSSSSSIASSQVKDVAAAATEAPKPIINTSTIAPLPIQKSPVVAKSDATASPSVISTSKDNAKRPSLRRHKDSVQSSKPLNILIYSDSQSARDGAINTLRDILEPNTYTVYGMSPREVEKKYWLDNTALLVVCGPVASAVDKVFVDYFLHGGKVLSICSDILNFVLPTYRTAEVREHELAQFSYNKWQKVNLMHHIFCYQPSPVKKNFSTDSDDSLLQANARKSAMLCPRSIELKDQNGQTHQLDVKVLATEETWNTPSILLANSIKTGGKVIFSQVHLETAPNEFETDETKYPVLKQNEKIRLEIFADLLSKHLSIAAKQTDASAAGGGIVYKHAYFLGTYESKAELLQKLKEKSNGVENVITTNDLTMRFYGKLETPPTANTNLLPILIHSCPEDFSTVEYFEKLNTKAIGRLVIYVPIVTSSMNVIGAIDVTHGLVVLVRQQTAGMGRGSNEWLSPLGCAMCSVQLHITTASPLGSRLALLQHIAGAAMVNALRGHELYKKLDIGLKWPNDIYANGVTKIGGVIVKTTFMGTTAIVNIGAALNLDNSKPTLCLNDLIRDYNRANHDNLPLLTYEQLMSLIFNELERLIEQIQQTTNFNHFYNLYYNLWLHNEQTVQFCSEDDVTTEGTIAGIDDYGYLMVKLSNGHVETVQPDGNSFDILKGLIVPRFK